jgi:peptide/nickel transport system ATP-binding protein
VFHTRCPRKLGEICSTTEPPLADIQPGHAIRCHIPVDELRRLQGADPKSDGPAMPTGAGSEAPSR